MPLVVVLAFVIAAVAGIRTDSPSGPLGPVVVAAPPHATAETVPCTKLLENLPVDLDKLAPRVVHTTPASSDTPFVVAWGDPAVVLACGAARPGALHPGSSRPLEAGGDTSGPYYVVAHKDGGEVWTTVDRGPYIALTFSAGRQPADYLPTLSAAIRRALPAVCSTLPSAPIADLCTRRTH